MTQSDDYVRAIGEMVIDHGNLQLVMGELIGDFVKVRFDDLRSLVARLSFQDHIELCEDLWDRHRGASPEFNSAGLEFKTRLYQVDGKRNEYVHAVHVLYADAMTVNADKVAERAAARVQKVMRNTGELRSVRTALSEVEQVARDMVGLYVQLDTWRFKVAGNPASLPARLWAAP